MALSAGLSGEMMSFSEVPVRHETFEGAGAIFFPAREIMDISGFLLIVIAGISVVVLSYALDRLWASVMPVRKLYLLVRLPGVVLHECAHVAGCLITGARIKTIVLFSDEGGSVTYSCPRIPYIGDVIIGTAPLFLLPLALSCISWFFSSYLGCVLPVFPVMIGSVTILTDIGIAIFVTLQDNLVTRFNGWFLLYLYLTVSIVLSVAPSTQDMKNAAAGCMFLIMAGILVAASGIPVAVSVLDELIRLLGYGFSLGIVYGLVALVVSIPLLLWQVYRHRS